MIQMGQDMQRTALSLAKELQRLGVDPTVNALTME